MMSFDNISKNKKLFLGILFDAVGYVSYLFPGFGELSDIIWAPISAWLMMKMYKGNTGKVAGVVSFVEEVLPGFDVIPTFTLTWMYAYIFNSSKESIEEE